MLRHWRYLGLNFGYFNSFHYWVRGGSWLRRLVWIGTSLEERNVNSRLSLGRTTFAENLKIFGWILIAVEHYTFDHFKVIFGHFLLKKNRGWWSTPPGFDQISLNFDWSSFKWIPSNWQSFIEISEIACATPAWSYRGCTLNFAFSIKIVRYRKVPSLNFHDNECHNASFAFLVCEIRRSSPFPKAEIAISN